MARDPRQRESQLIKQPVVLELPDKRVNIFSFMDFSNAVYEGSESISTGCDVCSKLKTLAVVVFNVHHVIDHPKKIAREKRGRF